MTCVRIIAQAEESARTATATILLNVNALRTGKGSRVTFLIVQTTVAFLTEASVMQVMSEGAPAPHTGRVGAVLSISEGCNLGNHKGVYFSSCVFYVNHVSDGIQTFTSLCPDSLKFTPVWLLIDILRTVERFDMLFVTHS